MKIISSFLFLTFLFATTNLYAQTQTAPEAKEGIPTATPGNTIFGASIIGTTLTGVSTFPPKTDSAIVCTTTNSQGTRCEPSTPIDSK